MKKLIIFLTLTLFTGLGVSQADNNKVETRVQTCFELCEEFADSQEGLSHSESFEYFAYCYDVLCSE